MEHLKIDKPEDYLLCLEQYLKYDMDTGLFTWKRHIGPARRASVAWRQSWN